MFETAELLERSPARTVAGPVGRGATTEVFTVEEDRLGEWDRYVEAHQDGTIFHSIAWRNAVRDAFRHKDIYLAAIRGERIVGVLPMFLVASRLAGRLLVSVPYGVGGGIIAQDDEAAGVLIESANRIATARGCRAIDYRSRRAVIPDVPVVDRYVSFRRELPADAEDVLGWLPRKARAAARNGRDKFGLSVCTGDEHLPAVWRLYTMSMRRLGSPAYPFSFFDALVQRTPWRHVVSLVRWKGQPVAGLVTLLFRESVLPYFIGTTDDAKRCSAAHFIYLTAMEHGVREGYRVFDFGRTRRDNVGSFEFKRLCGFTPEPLSYQLYVVPGFVAPDLSPDNPRFHLARRVWRRLPLRLTQALGARVARHVTG